MKIAVVGATGLVGRTMTGLLEHSALPVTDYIPVASSRSAGSKVTFRSKEHTVVTPEECLAMRPDLALFSAGGAASLYYAPLFAGAGCKVIDNSSAWRKDPAIPLVVPEVNPDAIHPHHRLIANPNCSTIQLVMVLAPLHRQFGIRRVVVSTYQSVSGSGLKGIRQLEAERGGEVPEMCYPHRIDMNVIPHGGDFLPDGTTAEEEKLVFESRKIMGAPEIAITATVVRVPVTVSHSESVNIEFTTPVAAERVREVLQDQPGIIVQDDTSANIYPMPILAAGHDEVFVGRIRQDASLDTAVDLWIVSDNVRKGAATNAIQIAELMMARRLL
ncbi:MAG: aspartate-semialdehyde dehydrogenase [Bacteroidales bacterium]